MTWTSAFGKGSGWLLQKIVNGLALTKISPNVLTFLGLVINIVAACFFGFARGYNANKMFLIAGLVIIGAGIFDMVDGRVARQTNQVSVFGAFFDSVMDRYSDVAIFFGLLIYYARGNRLFYVGLVAFVMTACVMVSYTRARAEALIGTCKVGFMERPERIVCVILGALCNRWGVMAPCLWVLALSSPPSPSSTASATPTSRPSAANWPLWQGSPFPSISASIGSTRIQIDRNR